jgi:DNA-binding NarL/FixJ family response regulator
MNAPSFRTSIISVSLAARNDALRKQLAELLCRCPGVVVFDQCRFSAEVVTCLSERLPRVLLLVDDLEDGGEWQVLTHLQRWRDKVSVVAISGNVAAAHVRSAFAQGAVGYLSLSTAREHLHRAVREVFEGGSPMSPEIARTLVRSFADPEPEPDSLSVLSIREREVLELLSRGARYREVATSLNLSCDTIHSHAKSIYRKLMVRSKTEACLIFQGQALKSRLVGAIPALAAG